MRARPRRRRGPSLPPAVLASLLAIAALASAGCTRIVKTEVSDRDGVVCELRHRLQNGRVVARGYQHPAAIAPQRLQYILGAIDVEVTEDGRRTQHAAIHPELLQPIARALVDAFERADPNQEVAVMAVRKQQRLGVFHRKYLTSLVAYFEDDRLYVLLSRIEWEIPKDREGDKLPEPQPGERQMAFRTIPTRKMTPAGTQGVAVRWRDALFTAPVRADHGDVERRVILMESPLPEGEATDGVDTLDLYAEMLRSLADVKQARNNGTIAESEYRERLENLLGTDGY